MSAVDEAIEVLNRIHAADPTVMPALIAHRVPCNEALADDPTVQVGKPSEKFPSTDPDAEFVVGILGVINGLFGADENTIGFIAAHYDDDHNLTGFNRTPPRPVVDPQEAKPK